MAASPEVVLATIEQGRVEGLTTEAARQARYIVEDAHTKRVRGFEDSLVVQGAVDREAMIATMKSRITARDETPEKAAEAAKIAALQARIAEVEALMAAKGA